MFFVHVMGRRNRNAAAKTLEDLGHIMTSEMGNLGNSAIVVAVGKTDQAVMPYVWIRRNDADKWEGELGDCIKLGIEDGLIIEHDPIQMLGLDQAIKAGIAEVVDDVPVVIRTNRPKKMSNEEKAVEAKRMVDDLFSSLHSED